MKSNSKRLSDNFNQKFNGWAAFGKDNNDGPEYFPKPSGIYQVKIKNSTGDWWDEVALFYTRINQPGVVYWGEVNMKTGDERVFNLGDCSDLKNYVFGIFIGNQLAWMFPDDLPNFPASVHNMSPAYAAANYPTNHISCSDHWEVTP